MLFVIFTLRCDRQAGCRILGSHVWACLILFWDMEILSSLMLHKQSSKVFDKHLISVASSGCPVSQSPAVDYGQPEISGFCSKRNTTAEWATNFFTYSDLINISLFKFLQMYLSPSCAFYACLQHWPEQTQLTLTSVPQRKRTDSMWKQGSFTTRAAKSHVSLCRRRKCHGRYFTYIYNTISLQ